MIKKTENEIMGNWEKMPVVSIKCLTYNHEKYIADALDSFLMQKTNFPFEIVIHDDASKDRTSDIILEYQRAFPHIVKPIYEKENQYSKGSGIMNRIIDEKITGKYVALCEGDDYWTNEDKLQLQFDAMEKHPEVDICAHAVRKINAESGKALGIISPQKESGVISVSRVIAGGGGFVGTNSLFYRKKAFDSVFPFRKLLEIDYTLQVQGALRGGMLYLNDCMSDYRFMSEGSWSARYNNEDVVNAMNIRWIAMTNQLDIDTDRKYHDIIQRYMDLREVDRLLRFKHFEELRSYKSIYKKLEGKNRKKYYVMTNFPRTYTALKKVRDRVKNGQ